MTITASDLDDAPAPAPDLPPVMAFEGRALRILTFSSVLSNAAEPWRSSLVRDRMRAIARAAEVEVMAPVPWSPWPRGATAQDYQSRRVPHLTVHRPRFLALPQLLKVTEPALLVLSCAPALLALRRRFQFDLLDASSMYPDGVAVAALAALARVPFTVTVRGDDFHVLTRQPGLRALIRWALRRAALVITHSQVLQRSVVALGVPESRTTVIPNGVDVEQFRPLDRETARACLGIPSSTRLVLSVGRLHRSKGLATLVDALGQLAHQDPALRLVFLGDPDPEADATPDIRAAIARSELQGRVTLVAGRSPAELVWWYNAADLVCVAVTGEGSAHALFEAMACGVPCVTTDVAGKHEEAADDRFGMLAAADSASLAQAIDAALRRWWDRDGIARYAQSREWEVVGSEWRARLAAVGAQPELLS